ncbi:hypothetical protein M3795_24970 [Ralstonia pickettii]|uniref:hypothetical protein n=1 Tax=Ralstonia pickettii TaxID=329 RepID=UPI00203EDFEB|nr:hypothetical protein [Ralstonia pickettii]MCM3583725.1 hypothetical protein [Ralstonia pickettii]
MTEKERKEMTRLGRLWATGKATKRQMLRHTELARKDAGVAGRGEKSHADV